MTAPEHADLSGKSLLEQIPEISYQDLAQSLKDYCDKNKDCNRSAIVGVLLDHLEEVAQAGGDVALQEAELERLREAFRSADQPASGGRQQPASRTTPAATGAEPGATEAVNATRAEPRTAGEKEGNEEPTVVESGADKLRAIQEDLDTAVKKGAQIMGGVARSAAGLRRRGKKAVPDKAEPGETSLDSGESVRHVPERVLEESTTSTSAAGRRRKFTRADYYAMGDAGILGHQECLELVDGEIFVMAPIGQRHAACVDWLMDELFGSARRAGRARVRMQNPLAQSERSEPKPDLMLLAERSDRYASGHPGACDVLLLVEVADSTLDFYRHIKIPLYAADGIREVWLVDLVHDRIDVYTEPAAGGFRKTQRFERGAAVAPTAQPDLKLEVDRIIPPAPETA